MTEKDIQKNMPAKDELIVIGGAGGFIGGSLTRWYHEQGYTRIRAIDKKPLPNWYQRVPGVESICMDLSEKENTVKACAGAYEVYNLAADMGGMGFIERFRVECLRSILINTHMIEAAYRAGAQRYFFSSSACAYNTDLQKDPKSRALKESDAYPAMAERGYGWEKLLSEMFCQEYWAERGLETHIARFHNAYGPHGTWDGGREKAPAALCRKIIAAKDTGQHEIEIWGDGKQTRSFLYVDQCVTATLKLTRSEFEGPVNIGSEEMVTIDRLAEMCMEIAGKKLGIRHIPGPLGVRGRTSDNRRILEKLGWAPSRPLKDGLRATYSWIDKQVRNQNNVAAR